MYFNSDIVIVSDLRRAKKTTAENVRFLLRRKKLKALPSNIYNIAHIKRVELDLSYNRDLDHNSTFEILSKLDNVYGIGLIKHEKKILVPSIGSLENLEVLNLWSNGLKKLPDSFANLKNLKILNLRNNHLKEIPEYFKEFRNLKCLNLQFNKIKVLPDFFFELTQLEELNIASCGISEIPPDIAKLKNLKRINISKNNITELPDCFESMALEDIVLFPSKVIDLDQCMTVLSKAKHLKKLDISESSLKHLPKSIGLMKHLEVLDISQNKMTSLPDEISDLNLRELKFYGNPFRLSKAFPVLGKIESYKQLSSMHFVDFKEKEIIKIPEAIGDCKYITSINLSSNANIIFPDTIANCSSLESISLYNTRIDSIPEVFGKIKPLRELTLMSNYNLSKIDDWVYELNHLDSFKFYKNGVKLDQSRAQKLGSISCWFLEDLSLESFNVAKQLPKLKELSFPIHKEVFELPAIFYEMSQLEVVRLDSFEQLDLSDFLDNVQNLKNLKEIYFPFRQQIDINVLANKMQHLPKLEILRVRSHSPITSESLLKFSNLQTFELYISSTKRIDFVLPCSYLKFPKGVLNLNNNTKFINELDELVEDIKENCDLSYHEIAYALKNKFFDQLNTINPFSEDGKLNDKVIFVASKPSAGTLTELRNKLKERGAKIAKKLTPDVTDILLTPNLKENFDWAIVGDYNYILEDTLKEIEIDEEQPYLMAEVSTDLITQITNLLKSTEENHQALIVELISGGGATIKLNSYLLAIHLFSREVNTRKVARNLFRKYASSVLQTHVKKEWKDSFKAQYNLDRLGRLYKHEEIDQAAFIHAWQMTNFHFPENTKNRYRHDRLRLTTLEGKALTESFADIDHLTFLTIECDNIVSNDRIFRLIKNNPLSYLQATASFSSTPNDLFLIPTLKKLSLGSYKQRSKMDLNDLGRSNTEITELSFQNSELKGVENILKFPNLTSLRFSNCSLDNIESIYACTNLKRLNIRGGNLGTKNITKSIESLAELEDLMGSVQHKVNQINKKKSRT